MTERMNLPTLCNLIIFVFKVSSSVFTDPYFSLMPITKTTKQINRRTLNSLHYKINFLIQKSMHLPIQTDKTKTLTEPPPKEQRRRKYVPYKGVNSCKLP